EACSQTRSQEDRCSCEASQDQENSGQGASKTCSSQARHDHASAQEFLSREASHRMDWQDPQFADSIVDRGIPEAAPPLPRLRCARADIGTRAAKAGEKKHKP